MIIRLLLHAVTKLYNSIISLEKESTNLSSSGPISDWVNNILYTLYQSKHVHMDCSVLKLYMGYLFMYIQYHEFIQYSQVFTSSLFIMTGFTTVIPLQPSKVKTC